MENKDESFVVRLLRRLVDCMRRFLFSILSVGPIPNHVAFILDGNRRFSKKLKLGEGCGHKAGFFSLMDMVVWCQELGVNYITAYIFSIDNFKRRPEEVQNLMDSILESIQSLHLADSIVHRCGIKVLFIGNLKLLNESVRHAAEELMKATSNYSKTILLVCIAYTSTDEITHAVDASCQEKWKDNQVPNATRFEKDVSEETEGINSIIKLTDIERHMYMSVTPDPNFRRDSFEQLSPMAVIKLPIVFSQSTLARDLRVALDLGCIELSEGTSLFREEKEEAIIGLRIPFHMEFT